MKFCIEHHEKSGRIVNCRSPKPNTLASKKINTLKFENDLYDEIEEDKNIINPNHVKMIAKYYLIICIIPVYQAK